MTNSRDLNELHPTLQRGAKELMRRMAGSGYTLISISSTYRCKDYQNYLYSLGRTQPGKIVTYAKGGESMHNHRLAFDIFKNVKGHEYDDDKFFATAGRIWTEMGGVWGGSWKDFVDASHFEYSSGLSIGDLQKGKLIPQDARMPWESSSGNQEGDEMRYNSLAEVPSWGQATIKKLMSKGIVKGNDDTGNSLDLSLDMIRILVMNDKAGLYG